MVNDCSDLVIGEPIAPKGDCFISRQQNTGQAVGSMFFQLVIFTLAKLKAEQNLNFPLLSDFNKETSQAYGALYEEFGFGMRGVSKRAAFVIDGTGKIS